MQAERTALEVHTVEVFGRADGVYYFADQADMLAFAKAVRASGGRCFTETQAIADHETTLALIAQEVEEDASDVERSGGWNAS